MHPTYHASGNAGVMRSRFRVSRWSAAANCGMLPAAFALHRLTRFRVRARLLSALIVTGLGAVTMVQAAEPPMPLCPALETPPMPAPDDDPATRFSADNLQGEADGTYVLEGDVSGTSAGRRIDAQRMTYDERTQQATAEGGVSFRDRRLLVEADTARFNLDTNEGELEGTEYRLLDGPGRGRAARAELTGRQRTRLERVTYTTCPPEQEDWTLSARQVTLDHESGRGTGRNMVLRFGNLPVAWLPWASFPLDDRRQTGFLVPTAGSSQDGLDVSVPYYLNLAPHYDATVTPRIISDRGLMLGGEFRYLTSSSAGQLQFEYLPDDDKTGDDRGLVHFDNVSRLSPRWRFDVSLNHASDNAYFEDFSTSLDAAATTFLHSRASLLGAGNWWEAGLAFDDFQTLNDFPDPNREPYRRLPRFFGNARRTLGDTPFFWTAGAEVVNFDRDTGATGTRIDLFPALGARLDGAPGYLESRLGLRHTGYELDREDGPGSLDRTLPVFSLDGGLVFERPWDNGWRQTLEPRFFYLLVPFEAQDDLPVFDTTGLDFELGQLFRDNRFSGADRFGDANRLTLALTSRFYDPATGRTPLTASVGQIAYFRDRRVQLPGRPEETRDTSPLITEVEYRPMDAWSAVLGLHLDLEEGGTDKRVMGLRYRPENDALFNLTYRFRRGRLEVADASAVWPVSDRWRVMARWYYDIEGGRTLEALGGLEYQSCCWAARVVARHYVHNRQGETRDGIYLQLELRGLGTLGGSRAADVLDRGILGYSANDPYR